MTRVEQKTRGYRRMDNLGDTKAPVNSHPIESVIQNERTQSYSIGTFDKKGKYRVERVPVDVVKNARQSQMTLKHRAVTNRDEDDDMGCTPMSSIPGRY